MAAGQLGAWLVPVYLGWQAIFLIGSLSSL